jgi:Fe-S cluster assembly iron-binding protein IscA
MLTLTADATQAIKQVIASTNAGDTGGIRLFLEPTGGDSAKLGLEVTTRPEPGDTQLGQEGANVYLGQEVVPLLNDKVLDVTLQGDNAAFSILDRGPQTL